MAERGKLVVGDKLDIWFGAQRVGELERLSESALEVGFRYDPAWMSAANAFPVSTRMPLLTEVHPAREAYIWFMNLLPEAADLQKVSQLLRVGVIDVFGMLREMGDDLPGAFEVRPAGVRPADLNPQVLELTEAELAAALRRLPERPLMVGEKGVRMSLPGVQHKLAVVVEPDGKVLGAMRQTAWIPPV